VVLIVLAVCRQPQPQLPRPLLLLPALLCIDCCTWGYLLAGCGRRLRPVQLLLLLLLLLRL
jgi:hypothetical protein